MPSSLLELEGRVAYVTGSTRGIGRAIAETLARAGAAVVVNGYRDAEAPSRYATELSERFGVHCTGISADQRDPEAIKEAYATINRTYGRLDILANNAGIVDDALLGTLEALMILGDVDALHAAPVERAAVYVERVQLPSGAWGPDGLPENDRLILTGLVAGLLGRTRVVR